MMCKGNTATTFLKNRHNPDYELGYQFILAYSVAYIGLSKALSCKTLRIVSLQKILFEVIKIPIQN